MKKQSTIVPLAPLVILAFGCIPAAAQDCDEFISRRSCQVRFDMTSVAGAVTPQYKVRVPVQSDVMIDSGGAAVTLLQHASPFLSCAIAASPGAPGRDLSASVTAALTTLSGLAIPAGLTPLAAPMIFAKTPPLPPALASIEAGREELSGLEETAFEDLAKLYKDLKETLRTNWQYSFDSDNDADMAVTNLNEKLKGLLAASGPDLARIQFQSKKIQEALAKFYVNSLLTPPSEPTPSELTEQTRKVAANVSSAAANADLLQSSTADFKKKVKQIADFLVDVLPMQHKTEIHLPMAAYRRKAVGETITCKDALSGTQPFDSMVYTAFYENTPIFDISAGAIMSFLPGRQVGAVSGPLAPGPADPAKPAPTSGACGAFNPSETCLGVTSATAAQFMPAAFFELHPINKKCPWAHNGDARHRFGYVCSFGPAGGIGVNPNNGTASAEFFEGVSFGIQRVALLVGIHNGRYQTFTDGYYAGEAVPSGTTARTVRNWTNHFAIGVSYRIPLR